MNNFSHSTLTLDGQLHNMAGDARIKHFTTNSAEVNLSAIFTGQVESVSRTFVVGKDRAVVITDEIRGGKSRLPVRWQMVTRAEVRLDGERAELRQEGRVLRATIISPVGASFEVAEAKRPMTA